MLVYFDESYDANKDFLILSALFNPLPRKLHAAMLRVKQAEHHLDAAGKPREIKYSMAYTSHECEVACKCVDCFAASSSWFRAIVVDTKTQFDLNRFGRKSDSDPIKWARAYKKFAELLLSHNCSGVENAVLLTDRLTRTKGDFFLERMRDDFSQPGAAYSTGRALPIFRAIQEVDTALPTYQVGQIGDILMGSILNALRPTKNRYKRRLSKYVQGVLSLPSLLPNYWQPLPQWQAEAAHPKFGIHYWSP